MADPLGKGCASFKAGRLAPADRQNDFFLAMAHWQARHTDQARRSFNKAVQWMEKNQSADRELIKYRAEASKLLGLPGPQHTKN